MTIAFLTPEYPGENTRPSAGLGSSIKNLAKALLQKGVRVSIFLYGQERDFVFEQEGIKIHLIKQKRYKLLGWYLHRKHLQNYINKFIKKENIQLLEAPDWTGITAFMKLKCPIILRMHGSDAYFCELENRPQKRKNYFFEKWALTGADHLLSVSKFTAEKTTAIFGLKKDISIIPNGIDTEIFKPNPGIEKSDSILYFGSIIRKKGVLELAGIFNNVVEENANATLSLLGKDVVDIIEKKPTYQLFFEKLSPQARDKVLYIPAVKYDEIKEFLNTASVVVLPSFAEAFPMTWLEAMAMEKAMVTSNIGWAPEVMVNNITGYMENPRNHNAFSKKILKLLNDRNLARKMGKAARDQIIEKFSTTVIIEKNLNFYNNILKD
ncbi:MAG: glycosyltransferase family 4 protein [Bacteroidota bacterium]